MPHLKVLKHLKSWFHTTQAEEGSSNNTNAVPRTGDARNRRKEAKPLSSQSIQESPVVPPRIKMNKKEYEAFQSADRQIENISRLLIENRSLDARQAVDALSMTLQSIADQNPAKSQFVHRWFSARALPVLAKDHTLDSLKEALALHPPVEPDTPLAPPNAFFELSASLGQAISTLKKADDLYDLVHQPQEPRTQAYFSDVATLASDVIGSVTTYPPFDGIVPGTQFSLGALKRIRKEAKAELQEASKASESVLAGDSKSVKFANDPAAPHAAFVANAQTLRQKTMALEARGTVFSGRAQRPVDQLPDEDLRALRDLSGLASQVAKDARAIAIGKSANEVLQGTGFTLNKLERIEAYALDALEMLGETARLGKSLIDEVDSSSSTDS